MGWLDDVAETVFGGFRDVKMQDLYGPDWRERLEEAERERGRAAAREERAQAGEERRAASERMTLADQLARHVAEAMEAEEEPGDQGRMSVGGYEMNLPTAPPPDYRRMVPADLAERTGMSVDDILSAARGKRQLSRRQLEILKGANRLNVESRRQGAADVRQGRSLDASMERLLKTLESREGEGEKNRGLRRELGEGSEAVSDLTPSQRRSRYTQHQTDLRDLEREERDLKDRADEIRNHYDLHLLTDEQYAQEMDKIKQESLRLTRERTLTSPTLPRGYQREAPIPTEPVTGERPPEPAHRAPGASGASTAPEAGTALETGTNAPETGTVTDITTRAEAEALPDGALFRVGGRVYRKQGNTAIPVE